MDPETFGFAITSSPTVHHGGAECNTENAHYEGTKNTESTQKKHR
jgi:hypothetical protein